MSVVLRPDSPTQYEFEPTSVYFAPFTWKAPPLVLTKPVGAAVGVVVMLDVVDVLVVLVVVVVAVPGRHWLYQSFEYLHTAPATQVVSPE